MSVKDVKSREVEQVERYFKITTKPDSNQEQNTFPSNFFFYHNKLRKLYDIKSYMNFVNKNKFQKLYFHQELIIAIAWLSYQKNYKMSRIYLTISTPPYGTNFIISTPKNKYSKLALSFVLRTLILLYSD